MKNDRELLEKFDHLATLEPSAEWNRILMTRIDQAVAHPAGSNGSQIVLISIILLIVVNIFSISKSWQETRSRQDNENMKLIASEYLISTNSSKY
jgi:hypothetical protein